MIGPLTAGKKGAEFGYKAYGVPGAVAAGAGGAAGVAVAKKGLAFAIKSETSALADGEGTEIEVESTFDDEPEGSASD